MNLFHTINTQFCAIIIFGFRSSTQPTSDVLNNISQRRGFVQRTKRRSYWYKFWRHLRSVPSASVVLL